MRLTVGASAAIVGNRLGGRNAVFFLPGAAPGAAAEGEQHLQRLKHPGQTVALAGTGADRAELFAELGVEHHWLHKGWGLGTSYFFAGPYWAWPDRTTRLPKGHPRFWAMIAHLAWSRKKIRSRVPQSVS